jgi:hypothetical protein
VTANVPTYAVFHNDQRRTHVAFNPTSVSTSVRFSDGTVIRVGPRQLSSKRVESRKKR